MVYQLLESLSVSGWSVDFWMISFQLPGILLPGRRGLGKKARHSIVCCLGLVDFNAG